MPIPLVTFFSRPMRRFFSKLLTPSLHPRVSSEILQSVLPSTHATVASFENNRLLSSVLLTFRRGGAIHEFDPSVAGISNILKDLTFGYGTSTGLSREHFFNHRFYFEVEYDVEHVSYSVQFLRSDLAEVIPTLLEGVFNPKIDDLETLTEASRDTLRRVDEAEANPARVYCEPFSTGILQDLVRESAYGKDSPLGHPTSCFPIRSEDDVESIVPLLSSHFESTFTVDADLLITAVGVDHEDFCTELDKWLPNYPSTKPHRLSTPTPTPVSLFQPDEARLSFLDDPVDRTKQFLPACTAAAISFEAPSTASDDSIVFHLIESLLGGGDSFSQGGPGRGLHSVIFKYFLSRIPLFNFTARYTPFLNSGLFTFYCVADHRMTQRMAESLVVAPTALLGDRIDQVLTERDLESAKNRLCSKVLRELEKNAQLNLWISGDIEVHGEFVKSSSKLMEAVYAVTLEDVVRCWEKSIQIALDKGIAWAVVGDVESMPMRSSVQSVFEKCIDKPVEFWKR